MSYIIPSRRQPRLFTFGCSVTKYNWITWADIVAHDLDCLYLNCGVPGAGNFLAFHNLIQAHQRHVFAEDDIIMIMWTDYLRQDHKEGDKWKTSAKTKFLDDQHSLAVKFIDYHMAACHIVLGTGATLHVDQMVNNPENFRDWSANEREGGRKVDGHADLGGAWDWTPYEWNLEGSMFETLDWSARLKVERDMALGMTAAQSNADRHPSPEEHFRYLRMRYPKHEFNQDTHLYVLREQAKWLDFKLGKRDDPGKKKLPREIEPDWLF